MLSLRFSNAIVTITLATFPLSASAQSYPGETPTVETSPNLQLQGRIEGIAIKGNTAFSDRELFQTANEFIGKSATAARLLSVRDAITERYRQSGYRTSTTVAVCTWN